MSNMPGYIGETGNYLWSMWKTVLHWLHIYEPPKAKTDMCYL